MEYVLVESSDADNHEKHLFYLNANILTINLSMFMLSEDSAIHVLHVCYQDEFTEMGPFATKDDDNNVDLMSFRENNCIFGIRMSKSYLNPPLHGQEFLLG